MAVAATLRGEGLRLTLHVEGYQFPEMTTGSDANWLVGGVELEIGRTGRFTARKQLMPFAPDLKAFRDQLHTLDRALTGQAILAHLEDEFEATITLEDGKGTLAGYVREHIGPALRFDQIEIDQTYVREALEQFDRLVTAFPVRGNPAD
jgi:hypothetical protein